VTLANQRQCLMTVQKPVILVAIYCKPLRNPQGFVATAMDCPKWRWSHCLRWFLRGAIPHRGWRLAAGQLDPTPGCIENIRVASSWCRGSWPLAIIDRGPHGLILMIIPMVLLRATLAWPHARGWSYGRWWYCWWYWVSMSFAGAFVQWFLAKNGRTGGNSAQDIAHSGLERRVNRTELILSNAKVLRCVLCTSSSW
jgi:hypothetical protein